MTDKARAVVQVRLTAADRGRVERLAGHDQVTVFEFIGRLIRDTLDDEHIARRREKTWTR